MQLHPIKSRLILPGDSLTSRLKEALALTRWRIEGGDIIAIASKVVSLSEGNIIPLSKVHPTRRAKTLGIKHEMNPEFVQVVLDQADSVYDGVNGAILTVTDGNASANSGVDQKNVPRDEVIPWPDNANKSADKIRISLLQESGKEIGVVIVDSRVTPMRLGTTGMAIGCSGFRPVTDFRGAKDLYGRKVRITFHAVADEIAAAAHLLMGETDEAIPFVLVRDAPVKIRRSARGKMTLPAENCLYMSQIHGSTS